MLWQKTKLGQCCGLSSRLVAASSVLLMCGTAPLSAQVLGAAASLPVVRRITLDQAQQTAAQASSLTARLGQLSVDAAREHRLATAADYFPKIGLSLTNLHFNKFMGQEIAVARRTVGFPLLGRDQTFVGVNVIQPITPLFKVRQAVKFARADENIARA